MALPAGFRFGVATSAFQIEGGHNQDGGPANNWFGWEADGRVERSGPALDFWNRYEDVFDKAVEAGCGAFRLSVDWARCEPRPGEVDHAALRRYRDMLGACHRRDLEPVVALHHFTHPRWLPADFWLDPRSPDLFAGWVATAVDSLGDGCRHWLTINEINAVAFQTYFTGAYPPGRVGRTGDVVRSLGHLLAAHVLAYGVIHRRQPEAVVSTNNHVMSIYELDRLLIDVLLGRARGVDRTGLRDWLAARRDEYHGALPPPGPMERAMRVVARSILPLDQAFPRAVSGVYAGHHDRPLDVVQINYYDPVAAHRVRLPGRRTPGGRSWSPFRQIWDDTVDPEGLATYCRLNHERGLDLWIGENGLCNRVRGGRTWERHDGWDRVRYLRANLAAMQEAIDGGVPVTRYFHWTLADNYEWGSYQHRFGLYRVDPGGEWSDHDAFGTDAAGAFRRMVEQHQRN